jgi:hypothetical protein
LFVSKQYKSKKLKLKRIGYLYGKFLEDKSAKVEFIYEPPQETTDVSFELLEDPKAVFT